MKDLSGPFDESPEDPRSNYLLYNERTALFDEYTNEGILIRANLIFTPGVNLVQHQHHVWPIERQKPKRAGAETWLDESELPNAGDHREIL